MAVAGGEYQDSAGDEQEPQGGQGRKKVAACWSIDVSEVGCARASVVGGGLVVVCWEGICLSVTLVHERIFVVTS
jgi:hypothetical protein